MLHTQQQKAIYDIDAPFFFHEETIIESTDNLQRCRKTNNVIEKPNATS